MYSIASAAVEMPPHCLGEQFLAGDHDRARYADACSFEGRRTAVPC